MVLRLALWDFPIILTGGGPKVKRKNFSEEQANPHEMTPPFSYATIER